MTHAPPAAPQAAKPRPIPAPPPPPTPGPGGPQVGDAPGEAPGASEGRTAPGRCPVCAEAAPAAARECGRCEARYHDECWSYNSGCAIYACRERAAGPSWADLARRLAVYVLVECCALYLGSVLALLFGVYSAMQSPLFGGEGAAADLALWSVMHAYDLALLGVIAFLFRDPSRREDGYYVAMAAVALTMDPTLFLHRFYTLDLAYGAGLAALGAGLSAAKMAALVRLCRVPLTRANLACLGLTYAVAYLGPAPLNMVEGVGGVAAALPYASPYYYLLCWVPLALAALSPDLGELTREARDAAERASVRAGEFRWVALGLPFAGVALHLWQLANVYDLPAGPLHLGPAVLAAAVLLCRLLGRGEVASARAVFAAGAAGALATLLAGDGAFSAAYLGAAVTPMRLMFAGQAAAAGVVARRFRCRYIAAWGALCAAVALMASHPAELAAALDGTFFWALGTAVALRRLQTQRDYETVAGAWFAGAGLVANLATGAPFSWFGAHLTALGLVAATHLFEGAPARHERGATFLTWFFLAHGASWARADAGLGTAVFLVETAALLAAAWWTPYLRYRTPVAAGGALLVGRSDLGRWAAANPSLPALAASFFLLGGGAFVSLHRDELLAPDEAGAPDR